jgi:hypothetical protein
VTAQLVIADDLGHLLGLSACVGHRVDPHQAEPHEVREHVLGLVSLAPEPPSQHLR